VLIALGAYGTRPALAYAFLLLLTLAFATLLYQVLRMALGAPLEAGRPAGGGSPFMAAAVWINLGALAAVGLSVPAPCAELFGSIVRLFGPDGAMP